MNKPDLINAVADKTGVDKAVTEKILQGFEDVVIEQLLAGREVTLTGFGSFSAKFRHARKGVNPQHPEQSIDVPAVTVPKFKAGKTLKDALKHAHEGGSTQEAAQDTAPETPSSGEEMSETDSQS